VSEDATKTLSFGAYTVELSHVDKVLYPEGGITKGEVIEYYRKTANRILPHLKDRPLTLQRFPDGIQEKGFYQKEAGDYFPDWITTEAVKTEAGIKKQVVCNNVATLVYIANQACLTPHIWLSRIDALQQPDMVVFDLDPPGDDFEPVRKAARVFLRFFKSLAIIPFLQLTGSRGLHVVIPLTWDKGYDTVRQVAAGLARHLADQHSDELTVEQRKNKRRGRVYLDTSRNAYGQTCAAPYALRARPGAPVVTPITPRELNRSDLTSQRYTLRNAHRRLGRMDEPWKDFGRRRVSLGTLEKHLHKVSR